jgi:hypothetical protein
VWIFSVKSKVQFDDSNNEEYCKRQVFNFAYGLLIFNYSLMGLLCGILVLMILLVGLAACCTCCLAWLSDHN